MNDNSKKTNQKTKKWMAKQPTKKVGFVSDDLRDSMALRANEADNNSLSSLEDFDNVVEEMICEVTEGSKKEEGKWEQIEAAVDSAAVDNVIPTTFLTHTSQGSHPHVRYPDGTTWQQMMWRSRTMVRG